MELFATLKGVQEDTLEEEVTDMINKVSLNKFRIPLGSVAGNFLA